MNRYVCAIHWALSIQTAHHHQSTIEFITIEANNIKHPLGLSASRPLILCTTPQHNSRPFGLMVSHLYTINKKFCFFFFALFLLLHSLFRFRFGKYFPRFSCFFIYIFIRFEGCVAKHENIFRNCRFSASIASYTELKQCRNEIEYDSLHSNKFISIKC